MAERLVEMHGLCHTYQDQTEVRAEGLPFVVKAGQRVALVGATGTGKTTLLLHILGLLRPAKGQVQVLGCDPARDFDTVRWEIGAVMQNPDEQIIGPTVFDDIAFGLRARGLPSAQVEERVQAMAQELGLTALLNKVPHHLSGGQKQKVALAGALISRPRLLVLDEPFSGLDPRGKRELVRLICHHSEQLGMAVILSTHDLELVPEIAHQVYVLYDGQLVLSGSPEEVFTCVDQLLAADLEPPVIIQLGLQLVEMGLLTQVPLNLEAGQSLLKGNRVRVKGHR